MYLSINYSICIYEQVNTKAAAQSECKCKLLLFFYFPVPAYNWSSYWNHNLAEILQLAVMLSF